MTYNFDEIIDRRNTNSENVEGWRPYIFHCGPERVFPYKDEEFIRMWVADMEFAVAPEILQAITDRVHRRILGYTLVYDKGYYEVLRAWCESRYGWSFPKEQLTFSPGAVPADGGPGQAAERQGPDHDACLRLLPPRLRIQRRGAGDLAPAGGGRPLLHRLGGP